MAEELKIWALHEEDEVEAVENLRDWASEEGLEDTLVQHPNLLEVGLQLVGRQTPTGGGPLDLLGVDAGGRLVIFELKRGALTRDAITQCIDYASALDEMSIDELASLIADQSGEGGIDAIEHFEDWYRDRYPDQYSSGELSGLFPLRLVLVGLGSDERAERMAQFLSGYGLDISVLTFHGFRHGGERLLARQVDVERDAPTPPRLRRPAVSERRANLNVQLAQSGLTDLFRDIFGTLRDTLPPEATEETLQTGISLHLKATDPVSGRTRDLVFSSVLANFGAGSISIGMPIAALERYGGALHLLEAEGVAVQDRLQGGGSEVIVGSEEQWGQQRDTVVEFMKAALESWAEAPIAPVDARLRDFVGSVPKGKVVTYGQVADEVGSVAQAVGSWIKGLPQDTDIPWWRVVNRAGGISFDDPERPEWQQNLLARDGVTVDSDGRIDLDKYQWSG
ncbi:MAG: endonuclease NucS [Chloroflexota bacterium]|nr:endonuclease NucS [Chloroflexota bacterium]